MFRIISGQAHKKYKRLERTVKQQERLLRELRSKVNPAVSRLVPPAPGLTAALPEGLKEYFADKTLVNFQLNRGQADHYYHFLLGVFVPLVEFLGDKDINIVIGDCGPMSHLIHEYADTRVKMLPNPLYEMVRANHQLGQSVSNLVGYDAVENYNALAFQRVRRRVNAKLDNVTPFFGHRYDPQILNDGFYLVVDRGNPLGYYSTVSSAYNLSGNQRRSINNLFAVYQQLRESRPAIYVFLELLPFWEQVFLFKHARVIVGQHGAGLANLLWAERTPRVVEICTRDDPSFFEKLASSLNCRHERFLVDGNHITLPAANFLSFLLGF